MYKFGKYKIEILSNSATVRETITEFQSLKIIDVANGVGSWKITTTSKTKCPFLPGDYIKVYRDNVFIYGGVFLNYEEEYITKYSTWVWSASGANFLKILDWKIIQPECDAMRRYTSREFTMTNEHVPYIIYTLIENNAKYASGYGRWPGGFYLVAGASEIAPIQRPDASVSLRGENLLETVSSLANNAELFIIPFCTEYNTVWYGITCGNDLSSTIVFRDDLDQVKSFRHIVTCPEYTDIIMSYNSEDDDSYNYPMWVYSETEEIPNLDSWRNYYQVREIAIKPKKEDFAGTFSRAKLEELCELEAKNTKIGSDCYEVEIDPVMATYTYGYDRSGYDFTTDYRIGDKIGIRVNGTTYTGRITRMEFDVSYGKEVIRPTIGDVSRGKFNGILNNIGNLRKSTTKTDNTEVS